ncbi:MAG TPA: L,D-transpeptidase [Gaiellaceae bacterium]|nr:L,D-transpeptidase [Gaiellaceae bacterium]
MRVRIWVSSIALVLVAAGALAGAALAFWPDATLGGDGQALAHLDLVSMGGRVTSLRVVDPHGAVVPVRLRDGRLWPLRTLAPGETLRVDLTVKRPSWAAWLVGDTSRRTFTVTTPAASLRARWLTVRANEPVHVTFDAPVSVVKVGSRTLRLATPRRVVETGIVASGAHASGAVRVTASARPWERLARAVTVTWFPRGRAHSVLVLPRPGASLSPASTLRLSFAEPVSVVLGSEQPQLTPAVPGRWATIDAHTLLFRPAGLGFGLGSHVVVRLPRSVDVDGRTTRTISWQVPDGSILRAQQLLAQLGYLPVDWQPASAAAARPSVREQLAYAVAPPAGRFTWRYPNTPSELQALWRPGEANEIMRGALMMFQDTHGLAVDGFAGPITWHALLEDAIAGKRRTAGYSYVYVHTTVPQSLNLWHDGRVILTSPGNTGVPAAPTALGTFEVFEHIPVGTMSGTNPDGSHYHDTGIQWISYFHNGEAIHAFNRASFGTPQSLGCVELPLAAAAKVWPYTPIGTLVTVES